MKLLFVFSFIAVLSNSAFAPLPKKFSYVAENLIGTTTNRRNKMKEALELLVMVMNDKKFKDEIKTTNFRFDRLDDPNRGSTMKQVVSKIYKGKERYKQNADSTANIYWVIKNKLKPRNDSSPTIGYTKPSIKTIYTYSWAVDQYKVSTLAGHIAHEWSHKLGFMHKPNKHSYREKTVPYAFGYLVAKHAARLKGIAFTDKEYYDFECGETNSEL